MRHINSFLFQFSAGDASHEFSETLPALAEIVNLRLELRKAINVRTLNIVYGQVWCITRRPRADRRTGMPLESTEQRRFNFSIYSANAPYTVSDEHRLVGSAWLYGEDRLPTGELYHLYKTPWEPPTLVRKSLK